MNAVAERQSTQLAPVVDERSALMGAIIRAASDPAIDIDKMERIMGLHERMVARDAERSFNDGMNHAQEELGPIARDADNSQTRSKYATYMALDRAIRPVYARHGFSLSFDTADQASPDIVRVVCYVGHKEGHSRTYHVDMPADGKGAKGGDVMTKTHATGAAMSYGQRYLLKLIFNIAVGEDKDGNRPRAPRQEPTAFAATAMAMVSKLATEAACEAWWRDNVASIREATQSDRDQIIAALKERKGDIIRGHTKDGEVA